MTQHSKPIIELGAADQYVDELEAEIARLRQDKAEILGALNALMGTCCHLAEWERKWPNVVEICRTVSAKHGETPIAAAKP